MNINLHIERLILDGVPITNDQSDSVKGAVEFELTRLLGSGGLSDVLHSGGALDKVKTGEVQLTTDTRPARLGAQIAGAVYGGIGR